MKDYRKRIKYDWHNVDLKRRYGITVADYKVMFENQKGLCAICEQHQDNFKRRFCVDHCHDTGIVRGLLCDNCNSGIGKLGDDIDYLKAAIMYLQKTQTGIIHTHLTPSGKTFNEEKEEAKCNTSRDISKSARASDRKATQEGDE